MNSTPAFQKSYDFYKDFYINLRHIPKQDRFTWGEKCEVNALVLLQLVSDATYAKKQTKRQLLIKASQHIDHLKIYMRLGSDLKIVSKKTYIARTSQLVELGKMIGGWIKQV